MMRAKNALEHVWRFPVNFFSVSSLRTYWRDEEEGREAFFLFTKLFSTQNLIPQSALKFWPLEKLKTLPPKILSFSN